MALNSSCWSDVFGGYSEWRLPDFPLPTELVTEDDCVDESLVEAFADRIASFYYENPVEFGFLFKRALKVQSLQQLNFTNPVSNLLSRQGFTTPGELENFVTAKYLRFRGVGRGNYLSLLKSLIRMNLKMATTTPLELTLGLISPSQHEPLGSDSLDFFDFYSHILAASRVAPGSVYEKVLAAALFSNFVSGPEESVLQLASEFDTSEARALDGNLRSISARTLLGGVETPTFSEVALEFVESLDAKERLVLLNRFLAEKPLTLDEIGSEMGVSRERIRQVANKVQDRFAEKSSQEPIFGAAVAAFRHLTSEPLAIAELEGKRAELFFKLGEFESTAFRLFAGMDEMTVEKGWIYKDKKQELEQFAAAWASATQGTKYTTLEQLLTNLSNYWPSFTEAKLADWLEANGYVSYQGFFYFSKGASLVTVAKIILEVEQKPMTFKALFESIPEATSERAIRTRLLQDPDVVKSGKDSCALKAWGLEEFTTIHQKLESLVRAEGSQSLDGTIRKFVEQFGVAESAVRAYANAYPLQVIGGQIRLAEGRIEARPRKRSVKNVYRTTDGWAWRIKINSEHLRGSGSQCPAFLADQLEFTGESPAVYQCDQGRIVLSSSRLGQRNIGSIQDVCRSVGAIVDDQIMILFTQNTARVTKIDPTVEGEKLIRAFAALPPSGELAHQLSFALNLEATKSIGELVEILNKRKETDVSAALLSI